MSLILFTWTRTEARCVDVLRLTLMCFHRAAEIGGTVIYLASATYTNGQEIVVDGGYLAVNPSTA